MSGMLNVLSVDVEDYYHVEAFASRISIDNWGTYEPRVERNVERLLELFDAAGVRATFFVLGWVAERSSGLTRRIAEAGHEVGCHSFAHQRLHRLTPEQFRADIRKAKACLMEQSGQPVLCYRAPSFSIVRETMWAFDILAEEGFTIDSSVFPVRHDLYGIPDAKRFPYWRVTSAGKAIFEFPPSTIRVGNNNWGIGGGGYLRLLPYPVTEWALRRINEQEKQPAVVYLHPWEIDPDQPRIPAGMRSRLRHYVNLGGTEGKLKRLLKEFCFASLSEVCRQIDGFRRGAACPENCESPRRNPAPNEERRAAFI